MAISPLGLPAPPVGGQPLGSTLDQVLGGVVVSPYAKLVTPDPHRRQLSRAEVVEQHFRTRGTPEGHGFTEENVVTALLESFLHATSDGMSVMFAESVTSAHCIHTTSKGEYALLHRGATRLSAPGRGCRRRRSRGTGA